MNKPYFRRNFFLTDWRHKRLKITIDLLLFYGEHFNGISESESVKILNVFNTLTLKQNFWKTKTIFKKLEYGFLVESTKIENASFPCKTAISEANVKANKMVTTKWTYHKERKFYFSLRTSYKELICCTNNTNVHICTFCKRWSFIWRCFFPVSIFKSFYVNVLNNILCKMHQKFISGDAQY